jgi:2,3-bisphosphoglycerate-independent phosphoglycerate mutase
VRRSIVLVILDGLGDRPIEELGGKTPLEHASTPQMDDLAKDGVSGLLDPIGPGVRCGSDTSHLAILGYDPYEVYSGRGPFEAAGVGIELMPGDVAFRSNFATVEADMLVTDRRAGRIKTGTKELAAALNGMKVDGVQILIKEGTEHRAALVLRGPGLAADVSDTDPHREGVRILEAESGSEGGRRTARVLNEFTRRAHEIMDRHPVNERRRATGKHPANALISRGAGVHVALEPIQSKHGMRAAAVVGMSLIRGVARNAGMDIVRVAGATGGLDTDMEAKGRAAVKALEDHEFVFVHVKAVDICSHDGDFRGKVSTIERADAMLGIIMDGARDEAVVAVTGDHTTPSMEGEHSGDPVPLVVRGPGAFVDGVKRFGELEASRGYLGRIRGMDLMPILVDLAGRSRKYGA